jgi:hypothetical protein
MEWRPKVLTADVHSVSDGSAQKAKTTGSFKNIKENVLKNNAALCFSKICTNHQITPKYIQIKVNGYNKQSQIRKKFRH